MDALAHGEGAAPLVPATDSGAQGVEARYRALRRVAVALQHKLGDKVDRNVAQER